MAIYYFRNTGNTDWGTATNWSLTDGGGATGAVPTATDDAYFTANSGNATVTVTNKVCNSLITTGFNGTISCTTALTISGNVTLSATTTIAGTGFFSFSSATSNTYTRNSATINVDNVRVVGTGTYTFADTWDVKTFVFSSAGATLNSSTLNISVSLTMSQTSGAGTTQINLTGTGTWSGTGALRNNLTINTSGTITISGSVAYNTGTLTYTAGTVTTTGSTLNIGASTTFNTSTISWNNIIFTAGTQTLSSNLNIGGNLTTQTSAIVINGLFNVNVGGNLAINFTTSGTSTIVLNGTGAQTWSTAGYNLSNNLTINKASGTLTISGNVYYITGTLTYITGTVNTSGSTLNISASTTLNTNGILWNNFGVSGTTTLTLTSNFNIGGNVTVSSGTISWATGVNLVSITGDLTMGVTTYPSTAFFTFNIPNNLTVANLYLNTTASNSSSSNNCIINGAFTINVTGNFICNSGSFWLGTITGTGTIKLTGTGTFSSVYVGASLGLPIIIDTTGEITLGSTLTLGSGSLTLTSGSVNASACSLYITSSQTIGLSKNVVFANIFHGTNFQPIAYNITVTLTGDLATIGTYTTNATGSFTSTINGVGYSVFVGGINTQKVTSGTATFVFAYSGTWASATWLSNNVIVDTNGTQTWGALSYYQTGTITYLKGKFAKTTWNIYANMTLLNFNKALFSNIVITSGVTVTMNEFFSGSPALKTTISPQASTNYTITFQDTFEKIAKFVAISGATITRRNQLFVITDSKKSSTNSGIRYINSLPNGIAKGDPSIKNILTPGLNTFLISDPAMSFK